MHLNIKVNLDNDAFSNDLPEETIMCLYKVIEHLRQGRDWCVIHDTNGNKVGNWDIEEEEGE